MAATLTTEEIFNAFIGEYHEFKTFFHGHSYTGNQLGCAAALANLQVFDEERTLENLKPKIHALKSSLRQFDGARQCGFIGAVELGSYRLEEQMGMKVSRAMRERGVLTRPIGNVIVIMPPYCITPAQLRRIGDALAESIRTVLS